MINIHSIEAARVCGVNRFLFTPSACVYPGYLQKSTEVTPLKEEDAYPAIRSRFERILSEPELRERVHQKALSWKRKQQARYQQIRAHIDVTSRRV